MGVSPDNKGTKDENPWGRSRRRSNKIYRLQNSRKLIAIICLSVLAVLILTAGGYAWMGQKYRQVFFPNTVINGLNASGKTVTEIEAMITDGMYGYVLTLTGRDGSTEQIAGTEIGLHSEFDGELQQILASQDPLRWAFHQMEGSEYTIETMIVYDQDQLEAAVNRLECMDERNTELPEDAYISAYHQGIGYQIIPEQEGTRLVKDVVWSEIARAILNLQETISLEELDAYEKPQITADDERLAAQLEEWNRYAKVTVTYQFGSQTEVIDGSTIHTWLSEGNNQNVVLHDEQVAAYVKTLAEKYNTAYQYKSFKTSYGPTVTIKAGNYGWRINQSAETAALTEIIRSGVGQTREPVYSQTAESHTAPDYGNTYVEINLTAQHLYYYKDGKLLVESDFVSGNESKGWGTPAGAFPLTYKQRDATLKGEGYSTPVSYWMPFNGGVGLHDANWRSSFGGSIYKTGGSHGCINLPPAVAKTIYENITAGTPVLCYHLEGTESVQASATPPAATESQPAETTAAAAAAESQPAGQPQESSAEQTKPAESSQATQEQTSPAQTPVFSQNPIPTTGAKTESGTTAAPESAAGPGGEKTKTDSGVVDGPGM
ncbi:MAG: L,D-transpeptidase family protein [Lachnospiraceae bacterium]